MSKPARNATGAAAPGQVVNPVGFNRYEFLTKPIIQPKKKSFREYAVQQCWLDRDDIEELEALWNAAQENK